MSKMKERIHKSYGTLNKLEKEVWLQFHEYLQLKIKEIT
jgi:hypothetical protein